MMMVELILGNDCDVMEDDGDDEREENIMSEEVNATVVLHNHFGDIVDSDAENDDSGDNIWNDNNIPDPLSSDDEEEEEEEQRLISRQVSESEEDILALGRRITRNITSWITKSITSLTHFVLTGDS